MENEVMQVNLEYYKVLINVGNQRNFDNYALGTDECIEQYVNSILTECNKYADESSIINFEDDGSFIELLPNEEKKIFGIIGKSSEIKQGVLKRIKSSDGSSINKTDLNIENYKYFLFDTDSLTAVVMENSQYKAFQKPFTKFLESFNNDYSVVIKVERIIDQEIEAKINRMTTILDTEMEFSKNSMLTSQILSFENLFGLSNDDLSKVKINISVTNSPTENKLDKFKDFLKEKLKISKNFKTFKVTAKNEDNESETIDLIKRYLTKTMTIELPLDYLNDGAKKYFNEIKKALSESLII